MNKIFEKDARVQPCETLTELAGTPEHRRHSVTAAATFERELTASIGRRWTVQSDALGDPVIPGRRGFLYVFGPGQLGVVLIGSVRAVRGVERRHPTWEPLAGGDSELVLIAPATDLQLAARAIRAYSRKRLTPEQRQSLRERLQNGREAHKQGGSASRMRASHAGRLPGTATLNGGQP